MIIDTHVHIGNMLNFNMTEDDVLYSMDKYNIDYCIVSNGESAEFDHNQNPIPIELQHSQLQSLEKCLDFAKRNPNKIGVAVWVKPFYENPDKEL